LAMFLTAPTNKAVQVINRMLVDVEVSGVDTATIHSFLGLMIKYEKDKQVLMQDGKNKAPSYRVVFVDECSMIDADLWGYIESANDMWGTKFVFIGDPAQLPPINEYESITFQVENGFSLTKIVRQDEGNLIINLATAIRNAIGTNSSVDIKPFLAGNGELGVRTRKSLNGVVTKAFSCDSPHQRSTDTLRVLSWTNKRVDHYNSLIRPIYLGYEPKKPFVEGEFIVTANPVHNIVKELNKAGKEVDKLKIVMGTDIEGEVVSCEASTHPWTEEEYEVWEVTFIASTDGKTIRAYIPTHRSVWQYNAELKELARRALERGGGWGAYWWLKSLFADLRPTYSITVHRSQGSTFKNVFVDLHDISKNQDRDEMLQLCYVATTRASHNVVFNRDYI
jgi:hypothetical protein